MRVLAPFAVAALCMLGCAAEYETAYQADSTAARKPAASEVASKVQDATLVGPEVATDPDRKIIYNADIDLVVDDFEETADGVKQLAKKFGGRVADFSVDRSQGSYVTGQWVIRVPNDQLNELLDGLADLGVPEHRRISSEDVTEEYVDLEKRIANKQRFEERILELLKENTGKIEDVIAVEKQLAEVREAIERMQGRLNWLKNKTSLSTVTLNVREEKDYVPPQAPSLGNRIASAWAGSLTEVRRAGENFLVWLVGAAPWLAIIAIIGVPVLLLLRRWISARLGSRRTSGA